MEERLAECLAANRIYTIYEGGITMLRKLFDSRRKVVTVAVAMVALGAFGAWILAQIGPQTVPLRVTALEAELTSIKVPVNGVWKETGPIKISLSDAPTQLVGQMFPTGPLGERTTARIIWPVSVSAPLLTELGLEKIDTFLIGVGKRCLSCSPNSLVASDFTILRVPGLPLIVVGNNNCAGCGVQLAVDSTPFWQGRPGAELIAPFNLNERTFQDGNLQELSREAFKVASQFFSFPLKDVDSFLDTTFKLQRENMHEIVIYMPEFNHYQTADLRGTVSFRIGP